MIELCVGRVHTTYIDPKDVTLVGENETLVFSNGYAAIYGRGSRAARKYITLLHRRIVNAQPGDVVDHINGDKLDNRRCNLRLCPRGQLDNGANRRLHRNNTSGYKGVSWHKASELWSAQIRVNYKLLPLGYFAAAVEAARAYNEAALWHFGSFARINQLGDTPACS